MRWAPLSAHLGGLAPTTPAAFAEHACRAFDGHNCFCKGGEHCVQPAEGAEKAAAAAGHEDATYVLGCEGYVDGKDILLLDGHKKGLKGAKCVSEFSPNMQEVVKDGHETITMKLDDKDVDIVPRYSMRHISKASISNAMKLNGQDFMIPADKLYKRDEWLKIYKNEMHDLYDEAMRKLHAIIEKVLKYENKGNAGGDLQKEVKSTLAGGLFADMYAAVKRDCTHVAEIAQKICSKADLCPTLKCFRGEEEEEMLRRYNQLIFESLQQPGVHGIREGLLDAGVKEEVLDSADSCQVGVILDTASRGSEAGGKVASEEQHFAAEQGEEGEALPLVLLAPLLQLPRAGATWAASRCRLARRFL